MNNDNAAVGMVASLMALAARTAPKARGIDIIGTRIASGEDLGRLSDAMHEFGKTHDMGFFIRDAANVAASDACLIIAARGQVVTGVNCRGCGYPTCEAMAAAFHERREDSTPFRGPNCVLRMADLGIAIGSAVKTAALHNVDNRVMYSAGVGALVLGWFPDYTVAYGIPLKASGKNIFFDRASS
jgi:uncharacterized ferredoxin-like protein